MFLKGRSRFFDSEAFRSIAVFVFIFRMTFWNCITTKKSTELDFIWMEYNMSCRVTSVTLSPGIKISSFFTLIFVGAPTSDWTLGLLVTARRYSTLPGRDNPCVKQRQLQPLWGLFRVLILLLHYTMSNTSINKHMLLFVSTHWPLHLFSLPHQLFNMLNTWVINDNKALCFTTQMTLV